MWLPHQAAAKHAVGLSWLQSFGHALEGNGEGEGWGGRAAGMLGTVMPFQDC